MYSKRYHKLSQFTRAYITCGLWCEPVREASKENEDDISYLDAGYGVDDISSCTIEKIVQDCESFQEQASEYLKDMSQDEIRQAGHDFWLDRNGHGAGCQDRSHSEEVARALYEIAESFGSFSFWLENGMIYGYAG